MDIELFVEVMGIRNGSSLGLCFHLSLQYWQHYLERDQIYANCMRTCLYLQLKCFHVKLKIECLVEPKCIVNGSSLGL